MREFGLRSVFITSSDIWAQAFIWERIYTAPSIQSSNLLNETSWVGGKKPEFGSTGRHSGLAVGGLFDLLREYADSGETDPAPPKINKLMNGRLFS